MIIGISGHRYLQHEESVILDRLSKLFEKLQPTHVISGMAVGYDLLVCEACIRNDIPYEAALPFDNQEAKYSAKQKEAYHYYLEKASIVSKISTGKYEVYKYFKRNDYVVDTSDCMIVYLDPIYNKGGTLYSKNKALAKNIPVYNVFLEYYGIREGH